MSSLTRFLNRYFAQKRRMRILPDPCGAIVWDRATLPQTSMGRLRREAMVGKGEKTCTP